MPNPYEAAAIAPRHLYVATIAFVSVFCVAVIGSLVPPAVAHFVANAPTDFTMWVLRDSLIASLPFGCAVALVGARYAVRRTGMLSVLAFLLVFLIVVPLANYPLTAGPLVDYAALTYGCTILSAITVGLVLRRRVPAH